MLSAITAGVQLSQPKSENGGSYSSQQVIAAAMGMQMNNLGMQTITRNMSQSPTIQIRPGYVFNVLINKDMILPPWQPNAIALEGDD
jgi:type IV secretion system protein TrbI